jgi:predicted transposase YbfD/YdcC
VATSAKSNEITAIPLLLDLLDLAGALVTIDAMGCQTEIAEKIVERGGDYVLTVKENQPHLLEDIRQSFVDASEKDFKDLEHDTFETREKGRGREEYRSYHILPSTKSLRNAADWKNLTTIGMCYSERIVNGVKTDELRYFIGSRKTGAQVYGQALREHWGIENNLHWQLDVTFDEDRNHVSKRNGAENLALLRRLALSLLQAHPAKRSIAKKRLTAAINPDFLEEVLRGDGVLGKS